MPVWRMWTSFCADGKHRLGCKYRKRRGCCAFGNRVTRDEWRLNHRGHTREWRSVITLCACWFTRDFFFPHCWSLPNLIPAHISPLCLFTHVYFCPDLSFGSMFGLRRRVKLDGWMRNTAVHQPQPSFLPTKNLCTSNMCALLFVFSIYIIWWIYHVVITVDPQAP